jgi:glycosyltransferase involved in cell wall biosynthesis
MKVLHLYSSWTKGGAEKIMLRLIKGLEDSGVKNVIGCPGDSYIFEQAKTMNIKAYPLVIRGSFAPLGLINLFKIMALEKPDVIHAHQGKVFWPCVFMKWLFPGTKLVFHRHAQIPHKPYSRLHYKWADSIIAISKAVANGLIESEGVAPDKVRVVYNGVDFNVFNERVSGKEVRKAYGFDGCIVVGTAGAMNKPKGKGQGYLIEAAALLRDKFPGARYLIVGTGPIQQKLEKKAKDLGVSDIVVFSGYQEKVENFIAAMDIFCLLSWEMEGFGQVMTEAQAMGKPVIGTNVGGVPESFITGETGFLVPKENSAELARSLCVLIEDEEKRKYMGGKAINFVNRNFGLDLMVERVKNVYNEIYGYGG